MKIKTITQARTIIAVTLFGVVGHLQAANIIFNFKQTTANGTDLFANSSGALFTNSMSPTGFFSLAFVNSTFDFAGATRSSILSAIGNNWIASSSNNWGALSTSGGTATGGRVNVSFAGTGNGYDTTSLGWSGKKLVAVVSQGINPTTFAAGVSFGTTDQIAIVRGGSNWDSILPTDANLTPTTMTLDVADLNVLVGVYNPSVGGWGTGANRYDTIAVIPEPSTASLLIFGTLTSLIFARRRFLTNAQNLEV